MRGEHTLPYGQNQSPSSSRAGLLLLPSELARKIPKHNVWIPLPLSFPPVWCKAKKIILICTAREQVKCNRTTAAAQLSSLPVRFGGQSRVPETRSPGVGHGRARDWRVCVWFLLTGWQMMDPLAITHSRCTYLHQTKPKTTRDRKDT